MQKKVNYTIAIAVIAVALSANPVLAICQSTLFNPINDVCWQCIFPFRLGNITIASSGIDSPSDNVGNPLCICGAGKVIGLKASFFEPARVEETVKDPYCFNLIGAELTNPADGFLMGTSREGDTVKDMTFQQVHHFLFNVWALLELFMDVPCLEQTGIDVAYITEIDPTWNDNLLAFILNPEALLFGNPIAQMSCMMDSVASTIGVPLSPLFWCVGSWGPAYPLAGHVNNGYYVQDNALLAGRMIYKMSREGLMWDTAVNECAPTPMPIWIKEHYRMQMMKPVADYTCHPIGRSGLIWAAEKNPPYGTGTNASGNFDWLTFRKKLCCIGWDWSGGIGY